MKMKKIGKLLQTQILILLAKIELPTIKSRLPTDTLGKFSICSSY
jgi:hypothetical protein